jgi:branched-subunit amino acid transport protein AzlD
VSFEFLLVCVAVGVGTYLFRYLPTRIGTRAGARALSGRLGAFLAAVGVASVAALLAASLEPVAVAAATTRQFGAAAAAVLGLATTFLLFRWRNDVALATIAGAVVYGVVFWLLP